MILKNVVKTGFFVFLAMYTIPSVVIAMPIANSRIAKIENDILEIRRDELNYRVEKDMLKENFATNYQTILIVTGFISAMFTVLSIFGVKGIKEIQNECEKIQNASRKELNDLKSIKDKLEAEIEKISLASTTQASQIKLLELNDKAREHFEHKRYDAALEYFNTISNMHDEMKTQQDDKTLIRQASCLARMGRFKEALSFVRKAYICAPTPDNASNLAEFLLFENLIPEYAELTGKINGSLENLRYYLDAFENYQGKNFPQMVKVITQFLANISESEKAIPRQRLSWDFGDITAFLNLTASTHTRESILLWTFILVLDSKVAPNALLPLIK